MSHDFNAAAAIEPTPVGPKTLGNTDRRISPERAADRRAAAARFDHVAREQGWSDAAIAQRLHCSETYVSMLRSGDRTLELGHLERLGTLAIAYLTAAREEAETAMPRAEQDAERLAIRMGSAVGAVQDAVLRATEDGEIDEHERVSICGHVTELHDLVHQTRRTIGGSR